MMKLFAPSHQDSILLSSGEHIDPEEIEEVYTKVAPIKEMCVFIVSGMQGVRRSKVLWAIIVERQHRLDMLGKN